VLKYDLVLEKTYTFLELSSFFVVFVTSMSVYICVYIYIAELQNDCIGKDLEGSSYGVIDGLSWHLHRETKKDDEHNGVVAEIRTKKLTHFFF
jgi:hypothetical protein